MPGGGAWAGSPWAFGAWVGGGGPISVVFADAVRENCVRFEFSAPVYWSGLLDQYDASRPELFTVAPVAGTAGMDGLPARPVTPAQVTVPDDLDPATAPHFLDVWLDRPLSPYPAQYVATAGGVAVDALGTSLLDPGAASWELYGVRAALVVPSLEAPERGDDFANPQTLSDAQRAGIPNPGAAPLGTYLADGLGDYARDRGVASYKKRIIRMILARRGSFIHLPVDRGAGILGAGKVLATRARIDLIISAIEADVRADQETADARVYIVSQPPLYRVVVLAKLRTGPLVKFGTSLPSQ